MRGFKLLGTAVLLLSVLTLSSFANATSGNMPANSVSTAAATHSDAEIVSEASARLAADKLVSGYHFNITSNNGIVVLSGDVDTDTQASKAIEIVNSLDGVKDTNTSQLHVKSSNQPFTDTAITAKVKGAFIREKLVGYGDIDVTGIKIETKNGVVFLTGSADNQQQANNAIKIARTVKGVRNVNSKISIGPKH